MLLKISVFRKLPGKWYLCRRKPRRKDSLGFYKDLKVPKDLRDLKDLRVSKSLKSPISQ